MITLVFMPTEDTLPETIDVPGHPGLRWEKQVPLPGYLWQYHLMLGERGELGLAESAQGLWWTLSPGTCWHLIHASEEPRFARRFGDAVKETLEPAMAVLRQQVIDPTRSQVQKP
jgi:hypothetical protein